MFAAFSRGISFHKKGFLFGIRNPSFLILAMLPFLVTLVMYGFGLYLFSVYSEDWLQQIWHVDTAQTTTILGWLHWVYIHTVKVLLYGLVLVVMFYTFIVISNIVASPIYDHITGKYDRLHVQPGGDGTAVPVKKNSLLRIVGEELKKGLFAVTIPLGLVFIPVVGPFLSFLTASVLISWDYVDYSLSRKKPLFKTRLKAVWRHKSLMLGYGMPLVVPFLGLLIIPFAILGATILYHEAMKENVL